MTIKVKLNDIDGLVDGDIRTDYSGRGMYGRDCVGLVVEDASYFVEFVKAIAEMVVESDYEHPLSDFYDNIANVRSDGMGLNTIYYWPGVEIEES